MKKFLTAVLTLITLPVATAYFISCLTPYISPLHFDYIAFLALGFPYLAAGVIALMLLWVFFKKKVAFALFILLFIGYKNLFATVAVNISLQQPIAKDTDCLRVMTWNVRGFDNPSTFSDTPGSVRLRMFDYIKEVDPDILCIQEFAEHHGPGMVSNVTELLDLGYSFVFNFKELPGYYKWGSVEGGTSIFSKLPIIDSGKTIYNDPSSPEHIGFIDVIFKGNPVRIFATHFKSLNLHAVLYDSSNPVVFHSDKDFVYRAAASEKIRVFAREHTIEAGIAKNVMNKSPYPLIFCGDLNTVPSSYPYHIVSKGLQDAFIAKGSGLGNTMDSLPKTLRIDYLFVDKKLEIKNYQKDTHHLSDHFPQYIDVKWNN